MERVAVLGASSKPDRYSFRAVRMLDEHGHEVFPISPRGETIDGHPGYKSLGDIEPRVDTLTLYLNPTRLAPLRDEILEHAPRRVIFNPGTESDQLEQQLREAGIETIRACTLVLLSTGQFEQ